MASTAVEFSMLHNKVRGDPVAEKVTAASSMIHSYCEILVHFEVKMRRVHSVIITDGADLLTAFYLFSFLYHDLVEMSVE